MHRQQNIWLIVRFLSSKVLEQGEGDLPGPDREGDQHSDSSNHEEHPPAKFINQEGKCQGNEEGPYLKAAVDERLVIRTGDADRLKNAVQVVRYEAVTRTLGEE